MSNTPENKLEQYDHVIFAWDCEVIQIPSGIKTTVPSGTAAIVTQSLGGDVTLQLNDRSGLVQVAQKDAAVLYKAGTPRPSRPPASEPAQNEAVLKSAGAVDENELWAVLKTCYDPEIPINIVDLGLIYDLRTSPLPGGGNRVDVQMTLTAMGCGMGPHIAANVRSKLLDVPGVKEANVEIVWDPPWNQNMISDEGKKLLGLF